MFAEKSHIIKKIPGVGPKLGSSINLSSVIDRAEEEVKFMEEHGIRGLFFLDEDYPRRLKMCEDGPLLLYYKGNADFNKRQVIAIVGTRNATEYGKSVCEQFLEDIKPFNPLIISGLAYGIDICAHREALKQGLPTVAVLGHGMDRIYPQLHSGIAKQMCENGGLLTEFMSGTNPDRENFPKRNRIVAGISDAIIVVEAGAKGGALITAEIANSYNREVFAVPGRLNSPFSEGCNQLIKTNKAALISSVADLKYILGWEEENIKHGKQASLFVELSDEEKPIYDFLCGKEKQHLDSMCLQLRLPVSKALQLLMQMELRGIVKSYPGKTFGLS